MTHGSSYEHYYVPSQSKWPAVGAIGLGTMVLGIVGLIHQNVSGHYLFLAGALIISYMIFGWFKDVIHESMTGLYSKQMDRSFRWGMVWFIFSEFMFFAGFFGALFYTRNLSVPWLGGIGAKVSTHALLWPEFKATWPLLIFPDPTLFPSPREIIDTWGLPALNTAILLTSGATLTWAHWGLTKKFNPKQVIYGLFFTVALGIAFLICQAYEYYEAYHHMGLTLGSGIYGSTFFMLTGFHGLHVTIGTIMLIAILVRAMKGHFKPEQHFAFEAVAWYWHFVDVVWLFLFILVYWL